MFYLINSFADKDTESEVIKKYFQKKEVMLLLK